MFSPKVTTLANLLQLCISKKGLLSGKAVHAQVLRSGLAADTFLSNRLIELYALCRHLDYAAEVFYSIRLPNVFSWNAIISACSKAGNLELTRKLFVEMPEKNVVSWNTMISTLVRGGFQKEGLDLYNAMKIEGFMPTNFTFASVLCACGGIPSLVDGMRCHGIAVKVGLEHNLFVENALLAMYTKCGSIKDAIKVFDGMLHPNEVSFTAMMGGLMLSGSVKEAVALFAKMHRKGICIDQVAVSSVLGACARAGDEDPMDFQNFALLNGQSIQALAIKYGFESESHVANSLIDMYTKCGSMDEAELLFSTLPSLNVVSWNVLIAGYGQKSNSGKAVELLELMQQSGFEPDEVTYISLLAACAKSGDIASAHLMFNKIGNPNVASWNAILSGYCQVQNYKQAISLFREMQFRNIQPDRTTLAIILSSCSLMGLLDLGKQVHAASVRTMLHVDMFVASGLVDMYSKCGLIESARQVFDRMKERDVVSWNSMITGFAHHSRNREAFGIFKQMLGNSIPPTESSYASVINSCARLSSLPQGRQIHALMAKDGYDSDVYSGSALIDMYAKCGDINGARQFFNTMVNKNVVSWNEMIHGYAQNGSGEKAVELFDCMLHEGEKPNTVTFIAVLTACSHSGMVDKGLKILKSMEIQHGVSPLVDHYTCVIDALGRAGRFMDAEVLLDKMQCIDDPILWEVLLSACAVHGNTSLAKHAAEQLFRLDPLNSSPYVLLSNIYASLGRFDDASAVRALMSKNGVSKDRGYSWINNKSGVCAFMVDDNLTINNEDEASKYFHPAQDTCDNGETYEFFAA